MSSNVGWLPAGLFAHGQRQPIRPSILQPMMAQPQTAATLFWELPTNFEVEERPAIRNSEMTSRFSRSIVDLSGEDRDQEFRLKPTVPT